MNHSSFSLNPALSQKGEGVGEARFESILPLGERVGKGVTSASRVKEESRFHLFSSRRQVVVKKL
ncbi:MAG: hypothetical protein ACPG5T_05470 [Endozoicomonas sp.]